MRHSRRQWRLTLVFALCFVVILLGWRVISSWVVPRVIEAAYDGRSLRILNNIISGQSTRGLEHYLLRWKRIGDIATLALALIGLSAYPIVLARHRIAAWALEVRRRFTAVPLRTTEFLHIALWLGVVAGLLEGAYITVRWAVVHPPSRAYSPDVVWMAPITTGVLFLAGGVLALLVGRWRRTAYQGIVVLVFTFAAAYMLLRLPRLGLENYAVVLLALGIALAAARFTTIWATPFRRVVRHSTPWLVAGIALVPAGMGLYRGIAEWRADSRLSSPRAGAPNILLLILDTVRASNLSLYGYDRPTTPRLEQLAQNGVTFEMAIAPSAWTLPSHASIFTGRHAHELSTDWMTPLDDAFPTLAEVLAARGYRTAGFVGNHYYAARESGLARGFAHYDDYPVSPAMFVRNSWFARRLVTTIWKTLGEHREVGRRSAEEINARFFHWLSRHGDRPFFAFVNYFDSHDPYRTPASWTPTFASPTDRYWLSRAERYSPEELQGLRNSYDNTVHYLDAQIGALLDTLGARDMLANTLVIVASDHGEQFGRRDSRLVGHGNSLFLPVLHTPLIVAYPPRIPMNVRIAAPVSLRDIPATVLDVTRLRAGSPFPGHSLSRYWHDPTPGINPVVSSVTPSRWTHRWEPVRRGPLQSLVVDTLHYIQNGDGTEELYNVAMDPWERVDLAGSAEGTNALAGLKRCLASILAPDERHPNTPPRMFARACQRVHDDLAEVAAIPAPR